MKRSAFWVFYGLLLASVTIAGLEFIAMLLTPSWPAYELRPVAVSPGLVRPFEAADHSLKLIPFYNSWGMKDRERSLEKPPSVRFRTLFVGDSFLEGMFAYPPLPQVVEQNWAAAGLQDMEAINFGVSATGPVQYYFRILKVGLKLNPDVIVLMFYPGNDFVRSRFTTAPALPLVAERPLPSIMGAVAPRLAWQFVDRLGLSEFAQYRGSARDGVAMAEAMRLPRSERVTLISEYLRKYYFPDKDQAVIEEILSRNAGSFWPPFERTDITPDPIASWVPANVVKYETAEHLLIDDVDAERKTKMAEIEPALAWLIAIEKLAASKGVRLLIAVAPMGSVDPHYVAFWKPWPRYYSWSLRQEVNRRRLLDALRARGITPVDLSEDLGGISNTYRLTDGHWNVAGTSIVAKRIARELIKLRSDGSQ